MEKNGWKFIVFAIIVLIIIVGGFFLMQKSFPKENTTKVANKTSKKAKDIRIDKNKDYIYFENSETIAHDLDIEYKDVIFNFKNYESIQKQLNDEAKEYKDALVIDEELEEADFDNVVKATYKTYEYYLYDNYISLVVNYYHFDREDLISYLDSDTYVFDKETGNRYTEDELLAKFNLTKEDVINKNTNHITDQNLLTDEELDADASIEAIDDYAIFVDRSGRLSISIVVKNDQKDYNEVIILS